jgi:hypothetical protein
LFKKATGETSLNMNSKIAVVTTSLILTSCVLQVTPTQAASFEFSYKFLSGNTVSGTVDGDLEPGGDIISNLTNLKSSYSGVPDQTFSFIIFNDRSSKKISFSGNTSIFYGFVKPLPPKDKIIDNFGFALLTDGATNSATVGFFETGDFGIGFPFDEKQFEAEFFAPERWTLTQKIPQTIPEPNTILGLGILSLISFSVKKRIYRRVK